KLAMSATKGIFRLVGGKISKSEPIVLKTPTATLGIRGGVMTVKMEEHPPPGQPNFVSKDFGEALYVTPNEPGAQTQVVVRIGTGITFEGGRTVLGPIGVQAMAGALGAVEGTSGKSAGAPERPNDARVASTGVATQGSANPPAAVAPPPPKAVAAPP